MTHHLELTINHSDWRNQGITPKFSCDAGRGADCRITCEAGCEQWSLPSDAHVKEMQESVNDMDDAELAIAYPGQLREDVLARIEWDHMLRDHGECTLVTFIENDESDLGELFAGAGTVPLRSGVVELTYEDEYVTWNYPKETA